MGCRSASRVSAADFAERLPERRLGPPDVPLPGQQDPLHRHGGDEGLLRCPDLQGLVDVPCGRCVIPRVDLGRRQVRQRLPHVFGVPEAPVDPEGILEEGDGGPGLPHGTVGNADVVRAHGHAAALPDGGAEFLGTGEMLQGPGIAAPLGEGHPLGNLLGAGADMPGRDDFLFPAARCRQDHQDHQQAESRSCHDRLTSSGRRRGLPPPVSGGGFP